MESQQREDRDLFSPKRPMTGDTLQTLQLSSQSCGHPRVGGYRGLAGRLPLAFRSHLFTAVKCSKFQWQGFILQTDPQKNVPLAPCDQPHQQNIPRKRSLLPTKLGSSPGAKNYSGYCFKSSAACSLPLVTITRFEGKQACPIS